MFSSHVFRSVTAFLLVVAISSLAFADTLRLKDGSRIKGRIVGFAGGKFTVVMGEGSRRRQLTFAADEVESIEFDEPQAEAATTRTAAYEPPVRPRSEPVAASPKTSADPTRTTGAAVRPAGGTVASKVPPIEWRVKVTADSTSNGWTNSGWVVKKGQRVRISGDGTVSLGKGKRSTASGLPEVEDTMKLLKNVPTGALIAVIGDDNNDFIYIGAEREFTATRDGALFLGINEGYLDDNSGTFDVRVEILPDGVK